MTKKYVIVSTISAIVGACVACGIMLPILGDARARQTSETAPTMTLSQLLQTADASLTRLETRLQERKAQIESLQIDLLTLQIQLAEASTLAAQSQSELTETSPSLQSLEARYDRLSKQLADYRLETESQIKALELQVRLYKSASIVVTVSLSATVVYIIGDRLELW